MSQREPHQPRYERTVYADEAAAASAARSEALLRIHRYEEIRALRMRLISMFWQENPNASHPQFEEFCKVIDEELGR
jgi:hypothetical protein